MALGKILNNDVKRLFIVTGRQSYQSVKQLIQPYFENKKITFFYNEGSGLEDIQNGCDALEKSNADIIIAIGGGANLDLAKLINTFVLISHDKHINVIKGAIEIKKKKMRLIAIPTTAGTGSEATSFSVVYLGLDKFSVVSEYLLPDFAFADYALVRKAPKYLRACTAFDALSQSIESYWSVGATRHSMINAKEAIRYIAHNIIGNVLDGDRISTENIVYAAYLSGKAINISKTTAPHALSYYLTAKYKIPHGHAVALTLGMIGELNFKSNNIDAVNRMFEISKLLKIQPSNFSNYWYDLMRSCGLEVKLQKFGITKSDLTTIIDRVNLERLKNHPITLNKNDILVNLIKRL